MNIDYGWGNLRSNWKRCIARLMVSSLVTPVLAHHSGAMFDNESSVTLTGTIKQFQWSNPHCWIQVLVPDRSGSVEWSVEMGSPSQLFRGGWKPKTLQPGDKIIVIIHPMRDGTKGGLYVSATRVDGTPFSSVLK